MHAGERPSDAEAMTGESQQQGEVRCRLDAAIAQTLQVLELGSAASGSQVCNLSRYCSFAMNYSLLESHSHTDVHNSLIGTIFSEFVQDSLGNHGLNNF